MISWLFPYSQLGFCACFSLFNWSKDYLFFSFLCSFLLWLEDIIHIKFAFFSYLIVFMDFKNVTWLKWSSVLYNIIQIKSHNY